MLFRLLQCTLQIHFSLLMFHSYLSNDKNFITPFFFPNYFNLLFSSTISPGALTLGNIKDHTKIITYDFLLILCFDNTNLLYPIKTIIINLAL